jgi:hypothetical protein
VSTLSFDGAGWAVLLIRSAEPAGQGLADKGRVGGPTKTCPSGEGRLPLRILGDVPQRKILSRMDGQVRNDDVGLDLW